jgi:hypothetical protein
LTKPLAKKKEMTMSQMTSDVKAEKAAANVSTLVAIAAVRPRKAQAPTGSGSSTRPVMVDRKIASSDHACRKQREASACLAFWRCGVREGRACISTPAGQGMTKRMRRPTEMEMSAGTSFAPTCAGCEARG